jgi:hypothetical protein
MVVSLFCIFGASIEASALQVSKVAVRLQMVTMMMVPEVLAVLRRKMVAAEEEKISAMMQPEMLDAGSD